MANTVHHHETEHCEPCDVGIFARNNFFTGKLLLERDFTDEQQYFIDKHRLHNRRLHGWGVVCGLKVKQHPTPGCRDRFVCVEPGMALDCCGREIVVREEECFDIPALPAVQALAKANDGKPHELQLCLRYRECGSEPIPVLYDECGCDDSRCLPNRILESFEFDVTIDPPAVAGQWDGPELVRGVDIGLANATRVRFNKADSHLYVLSGTTVFAVDPSSRATLATRDLTTTVRSLDVSPNGTHIYAIREDGANDLKLIVMKVSDLSIINEIVIAGSAGQTIATAVSSAADGRFSVLLSAAGKLEVYKSDLESAAPSAVTEFSVPANQERIAISGDGKTVYLAAKASKNLQQFDLDAGTLGSVISALPAGTKPTTLLSLVHGAKQYLVVGSSTNLFVLDVNTATVFGPVAMAGEAIDLAGGPWVYALQSTGGMSRIQSVSVPRVVESKPNAVGPAVGFAGDATDIEVTPTGFNIYVAYTLTTPDSPGGVAVFSVENEVCADIFWRSLDGCDDCDDPNCVVIATIHGYEPGFVMLDPSDPLSDPAIDLTNKISRIDNRAGRKLLPSTSLIAEAVECILESGVSSGPGTQGPPGPTGPTGPAGPQGLKGDKGDKGDPGAPGTNGTNGTNGAQGPKGDKGDKGDPGTQGVPGPQGDPGPGLELDLTQISNLSWRHADTMTAAELQCIVANNAAGQQRFFGVVIAFTAKVQFKPIDTHIFEVSAPQIAVPGNVDRGFACRCPIRGRVVAVKVSNLDASGRITEAEVITSTVPDAIAFIFDDTFMKGTFNQFDLSDMWVTLRGDFVVDTKKRAVDAEFVRAELPTGDRPSGSKFGIQGGTFESWFTPKRG